MHTSLFGDELHAAANVGMHTSIDIFLKKLKDMGFDAEYRGRPSHSQSGSLDWGHSLVNDYICGYLKSDDISIRIRYGREFTQFVIEQMGNDLMNKTVNNEELEHAYECFLYILQDFLDSLLKLKLNFENFPKFTKQSARDIQIQKLLEKNTDIPLIP